jgi:hypothetical protein
MAMKVELVAKNISILIRKNESGYSLNVFNANIILKTSSPILYYNPHMQQVKSCSHRNYFSVVQQFYGLLNNQLENLKCF